MSKIYFTILGYLLWLMGRNKESNKIRKVIYDNLLHVRYNNEQEIHFNRNLRNLSEECHI